MDLKKIDVKGRKWEDMSLENKVEELGQNVTTINFRLKGFETKFKETNQSISNLQNDMVKRFNQLDIKIDQLDEKFDKKFDQLDTKFDKKFDQLDKKIDDKFDQIDKKFDKKFNLLDKKIDEKFDLIMDKLNNG